ncbi:MAG: hypothetical protein IKZ82_07430 [Clostridia bacterium]|nr:hypothetical protein [Clostridia bacterium]
MNNGESTLIKGLSANILAAILLFFGAAVSFLSGFSGWLGFILLALAAALFFIEGNGFIRRACVVILLLAALTVVSWLLFRVILPWGFFKVIHWIIGIAVTAFLVFSGLCALNGKHVDIPFLAGFIDSICK